MEVSSYGGTSTESSGLVRILKDLSASIEGEEVLAHFFVLDIFTDLDFKIGHVIKRSDLFYELVV